MEQLVCMESNKVNRAFEDPVLLNDERVLKNLLSAEDKYVPPACYFSCGVQTDIKPFMRKMVSEWMAEVCTEQKTEEEVFPLAMNYLDRFLCVQNIHRTRLQCIGAACMFLASKLKENYHISAEQLVMYTDHSITLQELRDMESTILQVLKWDLSAITPNDFVAHIVHRLDLHPASLPNVQKHAQTFIALCAADCKFMLYPPSMIAAGCIGVAVRGLGIYPSVTEDLHKITHIELECLRACQESIEQIITHNLKLLLNENQAGDPVGVEPPAKAAHTVGEQSTTPTDVRDINLMAVDTENAFMQDAVQ
ncbi:hypothetical protein ACOMHN_039841 [Nucella lapillus]